MKPQSWFSGCAYWYGIAGMKEVLPAMDAACVMPAGFVPFVHGQDVDSPGRLTRIFQVDLVALGVAL